MSDKYNNTLDSNLFGSFVPPIPPGPKPFNPIDPDKDLFPHFPSFPKTQTTNVYIVMEKSSDFDSNSGKPISVFENYNDAKMESSMKINRFVVGPVPFFKSPKTPNFREFF